MSQFSCKEPQRRCEVSAAILDNPNEMIRKMVYELKFECGGTERAIEVVARDTGLTYSKTYNLVYRRTFDVWSKQKKGLVEAFKQFVLQQERTYRDGAKRYAELNEQIERLELQIGLRVERQYGMDLPRDTRPARQLDAGSRAGET